MKRTYPEYVQLPLSTAAIARQMQRRHLLRNALTGLYVAALCFLLIMGLAATLFLFLIH